MSTSESSPAAIAAALPVALLVIDMQSVFMKAVPRADMLQKRVAFAIGASQLLGIEVVFTEQVPDKLGTTEESLLALAPQAPVFGKTAFSAFGAEGLAAHLRGRGVRHLLIAGIETPICVYQTATEALRNDFDVTVLADAVGCRRTEDAPFALDAIREAGAFILPSETVFYGILKDASDPRLRAFTQLVKAASA